MPDNQPDRLEWNEENFARVLADFFREAEADAELQRRLLLEPFELLSTRIDIPDTYRGGIFARERGQKALVIYAPPSGASREALPEGTTDETRKPDYEILCTVIPVW